MLRRLPGPRGLLRRALGALLPMMTAAFAAGAGAQSLEGVLMPGPVIEGHAKVEGECRKCHVPFDRTAQDRLCRDCHKEVDADVRERRGYHGRALAALPQACRACHTEHKGRGAPIVSLDPKAFDHAQTDFALRGAHAAPELKCESCHLPRHAPAGAPHKKWRAAPGTCIGCHRDDDMKKGHKGKLGEACADCHTERNWKESRFDHDKTRFPLRNKHAPVVGGQSAPLKCEACHRSADFKDTPGTCLGCHRKEDVHKARFGDKCDACHDDRGWKPSTFNHDTATKYPLRGKHATAKCESCHAGHLYRDKLATDCIACHQKDDKHQGTLGKRCGDCHTERNWTVPKFDHSTTRFALRGKHIDTECKSCHKSMRFKDVESTCVGCHRQDDMKKGHKGRLGDACGDCHTERSWKDPKFDHDKTRFALAGKHKSARCESCHETTDFKRTPRECIACHRKEDKHEGQLGTDCGACHGVAAWNKDVRFDHGRSRFPLLGRHLQVACNKCHLSARYRDAKSGCVDCHDKDDRHKRRLGPACAECHNARAWSIWDFDHDRRTRFALDGAHARQQCEACHTRPVSGKATLPSACVACHRSDDVHDNAYGPNCERCHTTNRFNEIKRRTGRLPRHQQDDSSAWLAHWFGGLH